MQMWATSKPAWAALLMSAGDARTNTMEAAKLFGIEVRQITGRRVFVAPRRYQRLERTEARQSGPLEQSTNGGKAQAEIVADTPHQPALAAQHQHLRLPRWRTRTCAVGAAVSGDRTIPPPLRAQSARSICEPS